MWPAPHSISTARTKRSARSRAAAAAGGNVTLGAGTLTTGGNNGTTTYTGILSGTGGLTKQGTGIFTLSGANTYTGATTINAGTLTLGAANRIADTSALTVAGGATFNLNNFAETIGSLAGAGTVTLGTGILTAGGDNSSTTYSGVMSGTGGLTKAGAGIFTLSGANTYTGATTINAGTLQVAGGAAIADTSAVTLANVAGATLDLNGTNETIGSLAGGGALGGNVTLGVGTLTAGGNNAATTYSGVLSGTGGLTKAGTGIFTLSGANTYTGATTINAGTLTLGAANRIADTSALTVAGGATFNLNNFSRDDRFTGWRGHCHARDRHPDRRRRQLFHHLLGRDERHGRPDQSRDRDLHALGRQYLYRRDKRQCGNVGCGSQQCAGDSSGWDDSRCRSNPGLQRRDQLCHRGIGHTQYRRNPQQSGR